MDPVIVAGAGPTGLALALCLARHDVPVILLAEDGPDSTSGHPERTAVLRPETADLLARIGYTGVHSDAARWSAWRTLRRRQEVQYVAFDDAPAGQPAPGAPTADDAAQHRGEPSPLHLPQDRLRRGLSAALAGHPLVTLVRDGRLDVLEQDGHGVSAHTRETDSTPGTWWRGSYLVGCDGPRSTVRKLLDVRFPGRTAVDRYAVAALRVGLPDPDTALLHRDPPGDRGTETTVRPLPNGIWRIDWSMRPDGPPLTADALVARIRGTLAALCAGAVPPYDLLGTSEYPVHQRLARRWRVGRAFLAGDAAHLLGALGTRGVEEGLLDAENLAWKLAVAWHHGASDTLLDSYQSERRGAVGARLRAADQALPLLRAEGALHALRQSMLSGSGSRHAQLLTDGHVGRGLLGGLPTYVRSPLTPPAARGGRSAGSPTALPAGAAPGSLVDDVPVIGAGRRTRTAARPARPRPAGGAGRTGHRRLGEPPLAHRRADAATVRRGVRAAHPRRTAGHRVLSGGHRPHRAADPPRRTPGGRDDRLPPGRAVRLRRPGPGRSRRPVPRLRRCRGGGRAGGRGRHRGRRRGERGARGRRPSAFPLSPPRSVPVRTRRTGGAARCSERWTFLDPPSRPVVHSVT